MGHAIGYAVDGQRRYRSPNATCKGCGDLLPWQPHQGNPRKWCSERCRLATLRRTDPEKHRTLNRDSARRRTAHRRSVATALRYRECLQCHRAFVQPASSRRRVCSDRCRWRRTNTQGDLEVRRSNKIMGAHRRRALALGLPAETFSRTEVFDRDSWMCGLCREPVAKSRRYPDLMSPTIDHIVPMVLGGGHTRANTQCAHFLCNSLKGQSLEVPSNFDALLAEGLERFDSALQLAAVIYP